uniref:RING-type domain-containing protein n=1 Tax=Alexandrium monilatum TaxID=311494 RepID=A0A7S4PY63_9DINO
MSKSVLRAIGQAYGLDPGVQTRVSPAMQSKIGLTSEETDFLRSLADCWLVVRMDDFDQEVQLSFFILCRKTSSAGASLRITKKTRGLKFMHEANFEVFGGTPLAHCTVLLRKRRRNVVLSFLEKDLTRRTRGLNLGQFLIGVALRASAPFCPQDADMLVEAADNGSGRLVAFYEKLGLSTVRAEDGGSRTEGLLRMRGPLSSVLAACSRACGRAGSAQRAAPGTAAAGDHADRPIPMDTSCGLEEASASGEHPPDSPVADELCAICIELLDNCGSSADSADRRCTLVCGHRYHSDCIRRWLTNSRQCPLCKRAAALQNGGG